MKIKLSLVMIVCILLSSTFPMITSGRGYNDIYSIGNSALTKISKSSTGSSFQKDYWAVLIGINDYPGSSNDVPFSINEILSFRNTLLDGGNWVSSHILVLTDGNATVDGISDAVEWLDANENKGDTSVFYYAGHGSRSSSNEFLDVYDGRISDDDLNTKLGDLDGNIVVILDSCYSGGFIEEIGKRGRVVLTACQKGSLAYQDYNLKSGIFGYFINFSLQKITKSAEGTFLIAYIGSVIYSKKLSQEYKMDYMMYPCIYDGHFGRTKIVEHHAYVNTSMPSLFSVSNRNNQLRVWKM